MKFKNLLNQKFDNLTITKQLEDYYTKSGNKKHIWKTSCNCGRCDNVTGSTSDFTSGRTWKCTYCVRDEASKRISERNKKYNTFDLSGEYGVGHTTKGEEFWFDLGDYEKIKDYCWFKHHDYFVAKIDGNTVPLHKIVMDDIQNDYDVNHIKTKI